MYAWMQDGGCVARWSCLHSGSLVHTFELPQLRSRISNSRFSTFDPWCAAIATNATGMLTMTRPDLTLGALGVLGLMG